MADNQMVKIVFDFDLGNVPASAKKLSQYLKDNSLDLKFTKASVDGLSASLNQLATAQTKAGTATAAAGNSVKKSNMQWTNLALVVQDLPYGFRGIQNNLPALIGGFAGMTGAIYLASSVIIALFTAWDNGMISFGKSSKMAEDYSKALATTYSTEIVKLKALYNISIDVTKSMGSRLEAAKALKEEYPGLLSKYSDEDIALGKAKSSYDKLTTTIINYSRAKAAEGILTGIAAERLPLEIEATELLAKQRMHEAKGLTFVNQRTGEVMKAVGTYTVALQKNAEAQAKINRKAAPYVKILEDTALAEIELEKFRAKGAKGVGTLDDPNIALLQAKQKYYKDDLLMSASFEQEILGKQRDLAVKQAELEKKSGTYIQTIRDTYNQLILNSQAETGRRIIEEQHKLGVEENKEHEKTAKEAQKIAEKTAEIQVANRLDIAHAILAINKQFTQDEKSDYKERLNSFSQYYNNLIDFATGNRDKQKAIYEQQVFDLDNMLYNNLISYDDYYRLLGDITKAWAVNNKAIINESFNTLMQIGNGVMASLGNALDMLIDKGATIGEVLTNAFQSLLKQLIKVTVAAAIAVALIAILFPGTLAKAGGALKLFGGLFSQGMGLGKDMFAAPTAKGGVFSGPSYRLVGEYPGAKTNPEVVAPLDKLKSMMGGGGGSGEFVLRGNDLVLAMQRSNSSLKLRRG